MLCEKKKRTITYLLDSPQMPPPVYTKRTVPFVAKRCGDGADFDHTKENVGSLYCTADMKIQTKDIHSKPNGYVVPIWNALECQYRPDQVYLTVVEPGCFKGPHLHKKRHGMFCCVHGCVNIVTRENGNYVEHFTGPEYGFPVVPVPPGIAAAVYNVGLTAAKVINMPSPAWSAEDQDEWPVEDWDFKHAS
jgi:dTDP-4-dehydrorhamnose 3,5-epimerase-like enzyme